MSTNPLVDTITPRPQPLPAVTRCEQAVQAGRLRSRTSPGHAAVHLARPVERRSARRPPPRISTRKFHTERVRPQCRVAGQALRPAQPPQNLTCELPRIRLKHRPAHSKSTAGTVRDGTSGGRERGSYLRWRGRGAPPTRVGSDCLSGGRLSAKVRRNKRLFRLKLVTSIARRGASRQDDESTMSDGSRPWWMSVLRSTTPRPTSSVARGKLDAGGGRVLSEPHQRPVVCDDIQQVKREPSHAQVGHLPNERHARAT